MTRPAALDALTEDGPEGLARPVDGVALARPWWPC